MRIQGKSTPRLSAMAAPWNLGKDGVPWQGSVKTGREAWFYGVTPQSWQTRDFVGRRRWPRWPRHVLGGMCLNKPSLVRHPPAVSVHSHLQLTSRLDLTLCHIRCLGGRVATRTLNHSFLVSHRHCNSWWNHAEDQVHQSRLSVTSAHSIHGSWGTR